jgi:DNA-binding NarL/FixJ family response regulator
MPRRRSVPHPPDETIRVVVVEPRTLLGVGVREVLDHESGIEVVAEVRTADEALPIVDEAAPDVILVSGQLSEAGEADATIRLHTETPQTPMVVLGGEDDDASIVDALHVGATGHVAERAEPEELVATIRRVAEGDDQLKDELTGRPDLVGRIIDDVRDAIAVDEPANPLTDRETEVLALVAGGLRNREIAVELGLSTQTVKNHLSAILHKLGAPNRTRAVMYAVRHGWLVIGDQANDDAALDQVDMGGEADSSPA